MFLYRSCQQYKPFLPSKMNPVKKATQRAFLNLLSSRRGSILLFVALVFTVNTLIELLHVFFAWGPFCGTACIIQNSNNIVGREVRRELCDLPIDVVYTWVNGSDPRHIMSLRNAKIDHHIISPTKNCTKAAPTPRPYNQGRYNAAPNSTLPLYSPTPNPACKEAELQTATTNRYRDNQELKYSLRSLEKNAPWIRHIYIVTNGQIPSWLDLSNPKVSVIPHSDIFTNKTHLPTFSSPSIETHLHRIPGLSKKFLYFNDDVFLGNTVVPDDFFTDAKGQKVFLAWSVPNCNEGCTATWIGDKFCDRACNVTACDFDGGDCKNASAPTRYSYSSYTPSSSSYSAYQSSVGKYCVPQCPSTWVGDRFCDRFCKSKECGFDGGDCGIEPVMQDMFGYNVTWDKMLYPIPKGEPSAYFFLDSIFDGKITEGSHDNPLIVRTATISQKYKILILTFFKNVTMQNIVVDISGYHNNTMKKAKFNVTIDTSIEMVHNPTNSSSDSSTERSGNITPMHSNSIRARTEIPIKSHVGKADNYDSIAQPSDQLHTTLRHPLSNPQTLAHSNSHLSSAKPSKSATSSRKSGMKGVGNSTQEHSNHTIVEHEPEISDTMKGSNSTKITEIINPVVQLLQNDTHYQVDDSPKRKLLWLDNHFTYEMVQNDPQPKEDINIQSLHDRWSESIAEWSRIFESVGYCLFFDDAAIEHLDRSDEIEQGQLAYMASWICDQKEKEVLNENVPMYRLKWSPYLTGKRRDMHDRTLKDLFAESLIFVNRLLNRKFKPTARRVPAHMPHMIDKEIMTELQEMFPNEWNQTSANRFRAPNDMQYAFSYFYYLMSRSRDVDLGEIFHNEIDTNRDDLISENELRTIAARLSVSVQPSMLRHLEETIRNGSSKGLVDYEGFSNAVLTKKIDISQIALGYSTKYEIVGTDDVDFLMVGDNVTKVLPQLDGVRKRKLKFVCINDNMQGDEPNIPVLDAVKDLYESFFPIPSSFELPEGQTNTYLHVDEYENEEKRKLRERYYENAEYTLLAIVIFVVIIFGRPDLWITQTIRKWTKKRQDRSSRKLLDV